MTSAHPEFELHLANGPADLKAVQRLRYRVFVEELGGDGALVDHANRLERDEFDAYYDHLMLLDRVRGGDIENRIVGVYRLMRGACRAAPGQFYCEGEYDLSLLKTSGRRLLELGRSCLHEAYRGGAAMYHLWNGLADYITGHGIEVLFGVASFHGTDLRALAGPLSLLHHRHLAPPELRVRALPTHFQPMDLLAECEIDRPGAMRATPALIKAYLKLGGFVGEGAFVDHAFNTTDVCLVMDMARTNTKQAQLYLKDRG